MSCLLLKRRLIHQQMVNVVSLASQANLTLLMQLSF